MEFSRLYHPQIEETLYMGRHKSGLRVFVLPKDYSKTYAIFATDFGSVTNAFIPADAEKEVRLPDGVAHFLEHKLFEGEDGNAFEKYAKTGASANAFTSFNTTAYLFSCTSQLRENLDILLSFVQNPYFTEENVQKEQGIIGQEIRMYEDDPSWRVFFNLLGALYHRHPVKQDIAGTVESIAQINKDVLYTCYNSFYHPQNMILFVAGKVDPSEVGECVDRNLRDREPQGEIVKIETPEETSIEKKVTHQALSVSIPMFQIGFKDTDVGYDGTRLLKKEIASHILLEILAGKASRLYQHLYKTGLINDNFYTDLTCEKDYGFSILGGESSDPKKVQSYVSAEIDRLKKEGISREQFETVRNVVFGRYLRTFNSVDRIAHFFVSNIFRNIGLLDFPEVCAQMTVSDVIERLNSHMCVSNMAMSVINPVDGEA